MRRSTSRLYDDGARGMRRAGRNISGSPDDPFEPQPLFFFLSFLIPIIGIILGLLYIPKPRNDSQEFGKICLVLGIAGLVILSGLFYGRRWF